MLAKWEQFDSVVNESVLAMMITTTERSIDLM